MRRLVAALLVVGLVVFNVAGLSPQRAEAQGAAPATLYGRLPNSLTGTTVEAFIGGAFCASNTVNANKEWAIQILQTAPCNPTTGATVTFKVGGLPATSSPAATWAVGGLPPDVNNGYTLTVQSSASTPTPTPTATQVAHTGTLRVSGEVPANGGFGFLIVTTAGKLDDLVTATGCPRASMSLYFLVSGNFLAYVPGATIAVVNQAFLDMFPGANVPANAGFVGRCR